MPSCEAVREMRSAISPRLAIITEVIGVMAAGEEEEAGLVVERRARETWEGRRGSCLWARLRDLIVLVPMAEKYASPGILSRERYWITDEAIGQQRKER